MLGEVLYNHLVNAVESTQQDIYSINNDLNVIHHIKSKWKLLYVCNTNVRILTRKSVLKIDQYS